MLIEYMAGRERKPPAPIILDNVLALIPRLGCLHGEYSNLRRGATGALTVYENAINSTHHIQFLSLASHSPPSVAKINHHMVRTIVPEGRTHSTPFFPPPGDVHEDARRLVGRSQHPSQPSGVAENPPDVMLIVFFVSHASTVGREQFARV